MPLWAFSCLIWRQLVFPIPFNHGVVYSRLRQLPAPKLVTSVLAFAMLQKLSERLSPNDQQ